MRIVSRAENWEKVYEAFQQVNFAAWDFNSIKESLLDYMKLYYPDDFNDYIESSEFIAFLELFAYIAELLAYRLDLNAHENFISTAQRKESILRLAKLLSYNASRNIPARGLVKITSISTTERIFDSNGLNLANRTIIWNDPNNPRWKEQFIIVMNKVIEQEFGTVLAADRTQVQDVLFEVYRMENTPISNNVLPYSITVSGISYPMELVPSTLDEFGPLERRPEKNLPLSVLYLSDGLGDASKNTGFFFLTKQGQLNKRTVAFDGVTPNLTYDILIDNCNEIDIWLNNVDQETGEIVANPELSDSLRSGEWERVDLASAQNIIFNNNPFRNKYEIETLDNDNFRIIFGDGKFSAIPSGIFDIWYRVSANEDFVIPTTSIQNIGSSFSYRDDENKEQTFSFTFSLTNPIQNASSSEDLERIRRIAPSVYYTQDRMVNGRDYNEFLLQDNTILKLRAINRTFAGDSKYIYWHDPREYYENVKIFGDDLVVYFETYTQTITIESSDLSNTNTAIKNSLINDYIIGTILQDEPYFIKSILEGVQPRDIRKEFTTDEIIDLNDAIQLLIDNTPGTFYMSYNVAQDDWIIDNSEPADWWIRVRSIADGSWEITLNAKKMIFHSDDTKFWNVNTDKVITYDTLNANYDEIVILKANVGVDSCGLDSNYNFRVLRQEIITAGENLGLYSIHDLNVIPNDTNNDGIPDNVSLDYLINPTTNFVYFYREGVSEPWVYVPYSQEVLDSYNEDQLNETGLWKREVGKAGINFLWMHRTPRYHLIDPSATNIIDMFIITRGYYSNLNRWLNDQIENKPTPPTSFDLRSSYNYLLDNKMISDTLILHPGKIKIIIGNKAPDELKATIKVIRSSSRNLTTNQIKTAIVDAVNKFFEIDRWEFGETFYFSELATYIHTVLPTEIDSVVLVPKKADNVFGDLYQVFCKEDEIIQPNISVNDIEIVESLTPRILKQEV
jgi:hypothetical protein